MQTLSRLTFAAGFIALGVLTFVYGDFALQWQPVPAWMPDRRLLAYASGVVLVAGGGALLARRSSSLASRVLFFYALLWVLLLKVPKVATAPLVEANWLGLGEISVVLACCWALFASLNDPPNTPPRFATGANGLCIARYLFAVALLPVGLSHFVYATQTIGFVPTWLPYRAGWAYLGGAGHVAAGLGVLFGVVPELAATLEAAMIGAFTLLVWLPGVIATPTNRLQWTAFLISGIVASAAWVVAANLSRVRPPSRVAVPRRDRVAELAGA
jgi:uncharacterized membrane protein